MTHLIRTAIRKQLAAIAVLLVCALAATTALAQVAGKVVLAVGDVAAVRGNDSVKLGAGSAINAGDTIVTGADSHAQLRFADDALVALKPDSEFRIERFNFNGKQDGSEVAVFRLVKGGFRTLTGQIGKINHDQYQMLTTQATIGIRGTHYVVQICGTGECKNRDGDARPGTYGGVFDGRVNVVNGLGSREFGTDEFFYVPIGEAPIRWLGPPAFLSNALPVRPRAATSTGTELRFAKVPDVDLPPALPEPPFKFMATEDLNVLLFGANRTVLVGSDRYTLELDATTNPDLQLAFSDGHLTSFHNGALAADIGAASVVDAGSDGAGSGFGLGSGLNWGRWSGSGSTIAQTLGDQVLRNDGGNLHYIYGNIATGLPTSGQVSYAAVGGTRPTDSGTGAVGTLLSGGVINVNFTTAQLALSGLSIGFDNANYTMSGTASLLNSQFSSSGPAGVATGCTGNACQPLLAGNFAGFLAGPGGAGIGMDYYFNTRSGSVIEGVAGYRKCVGGKC